MSGDIEVLQPFTLEPFAIGPSDELLARDPMFAAGFVDAKSAVGLALADTSTWPEFSEFLGTDTKFEMILPPEIKKGLEEGTLEFMKKGGGYGIMGVVRSTTGKKEIVHQAQFTPGETDILAGVLLGLTSFMLTAEITAHVVKIDQKTDALLAGQQSDRISEVKAGLDTYEQAQKIVDRQKRDNLLMHAVEMLNRGRRLLMGHLFNTLRVDEKEPSVGQRFGWLVWADVPHVEYQRAMATAFPSVKEDLHYIQLATAHLARAHLLQGQEPAARQSVEQWRQEAERLSPTLRPAIESMPYDAGLYAFVNNLGQRGALLGSGAAQPKELATGVPSDNNCKNCKRPISSDAKKCTFCKTASASRRWDFRNHSAPPGRGGLRRLGGE